MKLTDAIRKGKSKYWLCADIRKNPITPTQWFVMLVDIDHMHYVLVDDEENPILSHDLNQFTDLLRSIGIREFTVFL